MARGPAYAIGRIIRDCKALSAAMRIIADSALIMV